MNHRHSSILAFGSTLAAALLGAAVMTGTARAEGPIGESAPFVSSLTRAEVRAELMQDRSQVSSYANEWVAQQAGTQHAASGYTRAEATAEYIASRDQAQAMNGEDSGSRYFARRPLQAADTLLAHEMAR